MYDWNHAKPICPNTVSIFVAVRSFNWDTAVIAYDDRHAEPRFIETCFIAQRLYVAVFTERSDNVRVMSLRRANFREARRHAAA